MIDVDDQAPACLDLECKLTHSSGSLKGQLVSFAEIRRATHAVGFELRAELPIDSLPEALGCLDFMEIEILIEGKSMSSRVIHDAWVQRREVMPHSSGLSFVLSVNRENM